MTWMYFRFVERYITPSVKDISLINKKQNNKSKKKQNALKKNVHTIYQQRSVMQAVMLTSVILTNALYFMLSKQYWARSFFFWRYFTRLSEV